MKSNNVRKLAVGEDLYKLFGVKYFQADEKVVLQSPEGDLYSYEVFFGPQNVKVEKGDCAYTISDDKKTAWLHRGPASFKSAHIATVIRGYSPEEKSSTIVHGTNLPYVNGCSTRQIFSPERPGDPTLQLLRIPPFASEQAHHIHSTARVVYVLGGFGHSVVGMRDKSVRTELKPGMLCVLDKMCPHHFETQDEWLAVMPVHVWSSTGALENDHPMYAGTFMMNQGASGGGDEQS
ncbi:MAG: hypothetical protein AB7N80_12740 [Bdellovibrionales bacterium]